MPAPPLKPITAAFLTEILHYNQHTGEWTWKVVQGRRVKVGSRAGNLNDRGYWYIRIKGIMYKASRLAFLYMNGEIPPLNIDVDHKDRVTWNDAWDNLRLATRSQNLVNRRYQNRGLPIGVYAQKSGRYLAKIGSDHIGIFDTPEEASIAFQKAAGERYGMEWLTQD